MKIIVGASAMATTNSLFSRRDAQQSVHPTGGIRPAKKEWIRCSNIFRQISIISSHPPAGNASRWAAFNPIFW